MILQLRLKLQGFRGIAEARGRGIYIISDALSEVNRGVGKANEACEGDESESLVRFAE